MDDLEKTSELAAGLWRSLRSGTSSGASGGRAPRLCGDIPMRIARDGGWHYQGGPIGRLELVKLFASVLQRDAEGGYWLVTPAEMARIVVDDAPFLAVEMTREGAGSDQILSFRTNLDDWVRLDGDHPLRVVENPVTLEPAPYVAIRDGLEARLTRAVFYDLVEHGVPCDIDGIPHLGVWSADHCFPLGRLESDD